MTITDTNFSIKASDGQSIRGFYRDTGEGPVGVFLHGLLSDCEGSKSMNLWDQAVQKHRSWVRFDMRGHGQSDGKFEEFKIARAIEDLKLVLSQFPNRKKVLVGSSMGGWTAAQAALDDSLNIGGLVLLAPAFGFIHRIFDSLEPAEQKDWKDNQIKQFESPVMEDDIWISYAAVSDSRLHDNFTNSVHYNHPVHIIHGKLDDVVPVEQSIAFKKHASSEIQLTIIEDGDHRLTDKIDWITQAVDKVWPMD